MQVYEEILQLATAAEWVVGSFFWSAVGARYSDSDAYSVQLGGSCSNKALKAPEDSPSSQTGTDICCNDNETAHESLLHRVELMGGKATACDYLPGDEPEDCVSRIISDHAKNMTSQNASWLPECPVM